MRATVGLIVLVAVLIAAWFFLLPKRVASTDEPRPAVFVDMSFEDAAARASAEKRLLVVDFMADWCPPCKKMDARTWPDQRLAAWLDEHAVAVQVDTDERGDLGGRFGIQYLPTVVVIWDGREVARVEGYREPGDLLAWLDDSLRKAGPAVETIEGDAEEG